MSKTEIIILVTIFSLQLVFAQESPKALDEIKIKKETKVFSSKDGNVKINVANSNFKASPNVIDLLAKLPTIQISPDKETITVIGKGNPLIYIDNQRGTMNDLNSLSIEDIKTIEIINNPSSKYDAEGRVVILISRKLSKREGFEHSLTEVASFKKGFNNYLGLNSRFKKNKTEVKANFNYNQLNPWESIGNNLEIPDNAINTDFIATSTTKRPQFIFGGGIYHQINEDDYLSFNLNGKMQKDRDQNITDTHMSENGNKTNVITLNNNDEKRNYLNSFINYNKKLKSLDAQLFTGLQYSSFYQKSNSVIHNNYNDTQYELTQNRNQAFKVNVFSGRSDLEKICKNEIKWETGALYLLADSNTDFEVIDFTSNSNNGTGYNYKEQNIAGYSQLSGKIKSGTFSFGLRVENTNIKGKYETANSFLIDKNYSNWFPKLEYNIPIDNTITISFNYAKSIERPNYSSTSQVSIYTNPYLVFSRNLNLNPTITDEVTTNFQYKGKSVRLSFYKRTDPMYFAFSYDEEQNLIHFSTINYEKESGFNLQFLLPFEYRFWSSTNSASVILNKIEDPSALLNASNPYLYYYSNNMFKLPKEFIFSITGWGLTERKEGAFRRSPMFIINMALSKTFFKHLDCTLSFNDVFRNMNYDEDFTINNIYSKGIYYTDTREISMSISYKFGNVKDSAYKEKSIDENTNRIR